MSQEKLDEIKSMVSEDLPVDEIEELEEFCHDLAASIRAENN